MNLEAKWAESVSRRKAFQALVAFFAGSRAIGAQQDPYRAHSRIPGLYELNNVFDFEPVYHAKVSKAFYDYTAHGEGSEFTLRRNREAFGWVDLVPGGINPAAPIRTATRIFNTNMDFPIMASPTATHIQLHPEAEAATHRGMTAAKAAMIVSSNSSIPFEKTAAAAAGPLWFQLYPRENVEANRPILEKVQADGAQAICITVDQQASVYERAIHNRNLNAPQRRPGDPNPAANSSRGAAGFARYYAGSLPPRLWYDWKLFDQIRPWVKVPLLAKGILTAEDAKICVERGLDGVYVSNHGGRSMDYGPSSLEVLPEIVEAVRGRVPVIFDSGVRSGSDALKALALGANAVCVGRAARWGLGAYGPDGVERVFKILQAELVRAMAYTGCTSVESINRSLVKADFS